MGFILKMIKKYEAHNGCVYRLNGEHHRPNGPAIEYNRGSYYWYLFGEAHRYYGAASHSHTRFMSEQWCIHNKFIKYGHSS